VSTGLREASCQARCRLKTAQSTPSNKIMSVLQGLHQELSSARLTCQAQQSEQLQGATHCSVHSCLWRQKRNWVPAGSGCSADQCESIDFFLPSPAELFSAAPRRQNGHMSNKPRPAGSADKSQRWPHRIVCCASLCVYHCSLDCTHCASCFYLGPYLQFRRVFRIFNTRPLPSRFQVVR
jgi:hypothetical protein